MTMPGPHSTVTLTTAGGVAVRARVELALDGLVTVRVSAAAPSPAAAGDAVTLRWPAGPRGRYTVGGTVRQAAGTRLAVSLTGEPRIEQVRRFVRGGGGEKIWARPTDSAEAVSGFVQDLGEQGLRARFDGRQAQPGQNVVLLIELDDESVEVTATVLDTRVEDEVEVVFAFQPGEPQAQAIRRHVLRRQVIARGRTADGW
jgi:PilZ domain/TOBE domain